MGLGGKVKFPNGEWIPLEELTFDQSRRIIGELISHNPNSGRLWDILTCLRGPDSPSERLDMSPKEASKAYTERRARKFDTVEVIREMAFFGACSGQARHRAGDEVTLPPRKEWDHFDKHVSRAANAVGLRVREK